MVGIVVVLIVLIVIIAVLIIHANNKHSALLTSMALNILNFLYIIS